MDATNSVMIGFSLAASLLDSMGEKEEFVACVRWRPRFSNGVRRRWATRESRGGEGAREGGRVYIIIMSEQVEVLKRALSLCTTRILLTTRQGGKKWFEKSWANEKDSDVMLRGDAFGFMPHDH